MKLKRLTAIMVVITMIASMFVMPQYAFAYNTGQDVFDDTGSSLTDRGLYSYKILGTSSSMALSSAEDLTAAESNGTYKWKENNYVWVGIYLSRLDNTKVSAIMNGVTQVGGSVLYDQNYFSFDSSAGSTMLASLKVLTADDTAMSKLTNYEYSSTDIFNDYTTVAAEWADEDISTGPAEPIDGLTVNVSDLQEAAVTLSYKSGTGYIIPSADSDSHLVLAIPLKMKNTKPDVAVLTGFSNPRSTVVTTPATTDTNSGANGVKYTRYYDDLWETYLYDIWYLTGGQMSYYFAIDDTQVPTVVPEDGSSDPTVYNDSYVSPDTTNPVTHDKNANTSDYLDNADGVTPGTKTFTYYPEDGGGLARLDISSDGTNWSTVATTNYTTSGTSNTTVTLSSTYLAGLADGTYTLKFVANDEASDSTRNYGRSGVDTDTSHVHVDPTATLNIQETKEKIKIKIKTDGTMVSGDDLTLSYEDTTQSPDASGNYPTVTDSSFSSTAKSVEILPDATITLDAAYAENVIFSISPDDGIVSLAESDDTTNKVKTLSFTVDTSAASAANIDPNDYYTIIATFGLAKPTLTTSLVSASTTGSIVVAGSTSSDVVTGSSSPYTLEKNGNYTITASPAPGYKFKKWSNGTGDITIDSANETANPIAYNPQAGVDSTISAEFEALADITLKVEFDEATQANSVKVYKDSVSADNTNLVTTLTNATPNTTNVTTIKELTQYVLVPVPATASGYRFNYWGSTTTDTGNYTIADTTTADVLTTAHFVTKEDPAVKPNGSPTAIDYDKNGGTGLTFYYKPGGVVNGTEEYPLKDIVIKTATGSPITITTSDCTIGSVETTGDNAGYKSVFIPASKLNVASGTYTFTFENDDDYKEPTAAVKIRNSANDKIVITTPPTDMEYEHGEKLDLDGMKVTVSVDTKADEVYTYSKSLGGWYKDSATTATVNPPFTVYYEGAVDTDSADHDSDIMRYSARTSPAAPSYKDKGLIAKVTETNHAIEGTTSTVTSAKFKVTQKPITYTATISDKEKVYNGTTALDTGATASYATSDAFVTDDAVSVDTSSITSEYESPDVNWLTATSTEGNVKIVSDIPSTAVTGSDAGNYTFSVSDVTDGKITQATLNISAINNIPDARVGVARATGSATSTAVVAETASATSANAVTDNGSIYSQSGTKDSITLTYGWYYSAPASGDINSAKSYTVTLENLSLDNTNYKLGTTAAGVNVVDKEFDSFTVNTAPKLIYNYSDKFDLGNFKITVNYKDGAPSDVFSNVAADVGTTDTATNQTIQAIPSGMTFSAETASTAAYSSANQITDGSTVMTVDGYDDKYVIVSYNGHETSVGQLDVSPLNIKITVTGDDNKEYDGTVTADKAKLTPTVEIDGDTAYHTAYDSVINSSNDDVQVNMSSATVTAEYNSKDVSTADHLILKGLTTANLTIANSVDPSNYNITNTSNQAETTAANPKTTYITKRPLVISSISNIAAVNQFATGTALIGTAYHGVNGGATGKATVAYAYDTANGSYTGSQPSVIAVDSDHDKVEITFNYAYQQSTVNATGASFNGTPNDISVTSLALPAGTADNDNYSISDLTDRANGIGTINPIVVSDVTLTLGDDDYTYIDDDDFTLLGTVVTFKEGPSGETPTTKTYTVTSIDGSGNPVWTTGSGASATTTTTPPFEIYWGNATAANTSKPVTEGQKVTPPDHDKNSTGSPRVYAVHSNGTSSPADEVTVAKKKLTYVKAASSGAITKVYNGSNALLDSSKALITYTAGYGTNTDVTADTDGTSIVVTSTPTYPEIHANGATISGTTKPATYDIDFTAPTMTTNPYYELATGVTVTSSLTGTIAKRELDVEVKDGVTAETISVDDGPTSKKVELTRTTDFTIALTNDPVNGDESNGVATGDWNIHLTIKVEAEYTDFTKGDKTIDAAEVKIAKSGDYLDDYIINFTPKAVSGMVTADDYDYTVNTSNATVEVKDTAATPAVVAPKTSGGTVWALAQASSYTVTVTPASGYVFDSWSDVTGPTGFSFAGTTATETFTMPKGNVTMTANTKLLPKWNTAPTAIDRSQDLSFKVDSDFAPATIKIGNPASPDATLDYSNGDFSYTKSGSTYTIVIDKAKLAGLSDTATGATTPFEVDFTGLPTWAPTDSDKLTADVTIGNNATKTVTIENVSYTQPTGQVYGDKLNLDGFSFDKKVSQTNETDIIYNYINDNGTWKRKLSTEAASAYAAVTLADDGLAIEWSSTGLGTPEHDTTVLKHTVHDQNPELVVKYDRTGDTTVTNVTGAAQTVSAGKLSVGQKELTVTVSATGISKVYDATDAVDESGQTTNKDKITVTVTDAVTGDTITPTVTSAKFLDKTSGSKAKDVDTNKPVEVQYTLAGDNAGEYKVGTVTNITANPFTNNTSVTGAVTVRDVEITAVTFPSKSATATDGYGTGITNELFKDVVGVNLTLKTDNQVYGNDGDELYVTLSGAYPDLDLNGAANATKTINPYTHTIADKGSVVTAANYNFIWPATASGTVTGRDIKSIAVTKQPKYTENYTAPDNKAPHGTALDLTGLEVTITYVDDDDPNTADSKVVPWSAAATDDWTTEGLTLAWDGGSTTGATPTTNGSTLRHDTHDDAKLKVTISGNNAVDPAYTDSFDIEKKTVTVHAEASGITKVYDGNKDLPAGVGTLTAVIDDKSEVISDDDAAIIADNIEITNVEYISFHQNAAHDIVTKGKTALEASSFKWKSGVTAGDNYDFVLSTTAEAPKGTITKKKITITKIAIDPVYVNDSGTKLTKNTPSAGLDINSPAITKTGSPITGDTIKISYRTAYTDTSVEKDPYELILSSMDYAVTTSTNALGASADADYEIEWPDGTENPTSKVGIGAVKGKTVDTASISSNITLYHGQELDLTGTKIHVKFTDNEEDDYVYSESATNQKGWFKGTDASAVTGEPLNLPGGLKIEWLSGTPTVTDGEVLRYDDATGRFIAGAGVKTGTIGLLAGAVQKDSITVSIQPRPVTLTISGGIEKTYDGTDSAVAATGTNNTTGTPTYTFTAGNASVGGVVQTGTTPADELTVDQANTTVKFARAAAHDGTVSGSEIYASVTPVYNDAAIAACYDITVVNNLTSKINKRPLKITGQEVGGKKKIPTVTVGDPTTGTLELNNNEYTWDKTTDYEGLVSTGGDTYEQVIIEYDYDFGTNGTATAGDKTVTIPPSDSATSYVNPRIKNAGSGEVGANYDLTFTPSTDGKVSNKDITGITVTEPTKTTYVHGDALDLTGLAITLTYDGGATETFTFNGDTTTPWSWDKALPTSIKSIDWANAASTDELKNAPTAVQRYDSDKLSTGHTRTINLVYQNDGGSAVPVPVTTITVEQKKISTIAISATDLVNKPYDAESDADDTNVTLTPADIISGDTVKVNADLFYAESGTTTKAVNANADKDFTLLAGATAYDIQGENAILPAKSASDNNDCYILDPAGVTFTTTATGKIRQLEIDVTKLPVDAAIKDPSKPDSYTEEITREVQQIGTTDDRIQIDKSTGKDGAIMPDADQTNLKAKYTIVYTGDYINGHTTPDVNGVPVTFKDNKEPEITGITLMSDGKTPANYVFTWPTLYGSVVDNAISGLDTTYTATFYHGDKLNFGADSIGSAALSFDVTYRPAGATDASTDYTVTFRCDTNGDWTKQKGTDTPEPVSSLVAEGIMFEWVGHTDNTASVKIPAAYNDILQRDKHTGGIDQIKIKARSVADGSEDGYISKNTGNITILPLPIYAAVTHGDLEKVYNGDKKLEAADLADVKFDTFYNGKTAFTGSSSTAPDTYTNSLGDDISIKKDSIEYESEDVNLTGSSSDPVAERKVKLPAVATALDGTNKANYEFKGFIYYDGTDYSLVTTLDGKITQKPLDIEIKGVPSIKASLPDAQRVDTQLTSDYYTITGIVGSDDVDASIWYKYPAGNSNLNPTIDLKGADKTSALDDHAQTDLTGAKKANYDPTFHPASVTGTIEKATVNTLTVSGPTKTDYVHGDNADLIGLRVQAGTTDPSVKYDFEFKADTYGDNPGWRQYKASGYNDTDQSYPTLSAAVQAAGLADVITLSLVDATGGTAGTAVSGGLDNKGTLRHNVHNNTAFYATSGSLTSLSEDVIKVDTKKVYASVAVENGKYVEKLYDATPVIGSDESSADNKTKLVYTLLEKVADTGTFATDYQTLVPLAGETVTADKSGVVANFVDGSDNERSDVHGAWSPSLTSLGLLAVDRSRTDVLPWNVKVTGLDIDDNNAGNYEFVEIVGNKPQGTIYPANVTVTAQTVKDVYADAEGNDLTVDVKTWTATGYKKASDENDITFTNWKATYDLSTDPATVTVNTNPATITVGAASGATDANAYRNYDFTFAGNPAAQVTAVQAASIVIDNEPDFAELSPAAQHGTKISDADGWDNLEFTITYNSGKETHHKRTETGWVTSGNYTVPPADVTYTWSNGNTPINDIDDINDLPLLRSTGSQTNTNQIIISAPGVAEPAKTKAVTPEKKKVKVQVEGKYEKDYDGTPDVTLNTTTPEITFTIDPADIVPGDTVTVTPPTLEFTSPDVSDNNPIKLSSDAALSNDNYEIEVDNTTNEQVFVTDEDFKDSAIKAKKIKVTITVPTITSGGSAEASGTVGYSTTADTANGSFLTVNADDIAARDKNNIKLTYSGTRDTTTNTGTAAIETNVTLDALPTISGTGINPANYIIETATAKGSITPVTTSDTGGSSGGGGGGAVNALTIHYENEDGTAGDDVSKITVPLGTDPTDLIGVFKTYIKDKTVLWTSDNEQVATVDENGIVTYVGEGTATITAQSKQTKSLKDTVLVTVTAEPQPTDTPAPTTDPGKAQRTHERIQDSLITKTMLNPYIVGYDDYVFGPELPISREELAAIFARLIANNLYMDQDYGTSFPDVPEKWSKSYIGYLEGFNVVTGYEDGTFRPENYITRAEMAVMMAKAEGYDITPDISADEVDFPDVDEGYATWSAAKAIQIMSDLGIMEGYTDGTFRPSQPITRAETVATINRVLAAQEVADYDVLPSDVTDAHWAYNDIVFAMNHRILKDASADPNAFIWSEQFDENMINVTEKVSGEKEVVTEEISSEEKSSDEAAASAEDATAPEKTEEDTSSDTTTTN